MIASRLSLLACLCCYAAVAFGGQTQTVPDKAELFRWFDTLGFNERLSGRLVCQENWRTRHGVRALEYRNYGFELPKGDHDFVYFTPNLWRSEVDSGEFNESTVRAVDFRTTARALIALQAKNEDREEDYMGNLDPDKQHPWYDAAGPFVWARVAELRGYSDLSDELYKEAVRIARKDADMTLRASLDKSFGRTCFAEIPHEIADKVPYAKIGTHIERFLMLFPSHEGTPLAKDYLATIQAMAASDLEWSSRSAQRTDEETVAALIHQLPEVVGGTFFSKGDARVSFSSGGIDDWGFKPSSGGAANPENRTVAGKLVDMGYKAVPQLAAALTDRRLTRAVSFNYGLPHDGVLRVGDAAEQILEQIIPLRFAGPSDDSWMEGQKAAQSRVEEWWHDVERKGERQVLIDGVRAGDSSYAPYLVKKFPADAPGAIAYALARAKSGDSTREILVSGLNGCDTPAAKDLLRTLVTDREQGVRLTAIQLLGDSEPELTFRALLKEWAADGTNEQVAAQLLNVERVEAIDALASGLTSKPIEIRYAIMDGMSASCAPQTDDTAEEIAAKAPYRAAALKLLVTFLTDTEPRNHAPEWVALQAITNMKTRGFAIRRRTGSVRHSLKSTSSSIRIRSRKWMRSESPLPIFGGAKMEFLC